MYEYKPGGLSSPEGGMLANGWSGGSGGHPDMGNGCSRPGKPKKNKCFFKHRIMS